MPTTETRPGSNERPPRKGRGMTPSPAFGKHGFITPTDFEKLAARRALEDALTRIIREATLARPKLGLAHYTDIDEPLNVAQIMLRYALARYTLAHLPTPARDAVTDGDTSAGAREGNP